MALYEYRCEHGDFEERHPIGTAPRTMSCPHGGIARLVLVPPALTYDATPNKTRVAGPIGPKGNPSWERAVVTDDRGMPLIDGKTNELIRQKQYSENRHKYEAARKRNAQSTPTPTP